MVGAEFCRDMYSGGFYCNYVSLWILQSTGIFLLGALNYETAREAFYGIEDGVYDVERSFP